MLACDSTGRRRSGDFCQHRPRVEHPSNVLRLYETAFHTPPAAFPKRLQYFIHQVSQNASRDWGTSLLIFMSCDARHEHTRSTMFRTAQLQPHQGQISRVTRQALYRLISLIIRTYQFMHRKMCTPYICLVMFYGAYTDVHKISRLRSPNRGQSKDSTRQT